MVEVNASFVDSCHWSRSLKCDVCFNYFREPHTLPCGHSFCKCCLLRLAQSARDLDTNISINKVKLYCPTCRQDSHAKPILREDIATSFSLRNVVDGWKKEKGRFGGDSCIHLRSVSCQTATTEPVWPANKIQSLVSRTENHEKIYPNEDYISQALRVTESEGSIDDQKSLKYISESSTQINSSENQTDSDWENFDNLDEPVGDHGERNAEENVVRILWSPGRLIMTIFWFMYTATVTFVAHGFFPYMILYTLLFLLILYTENLQRHQG